MAIMGLVLRRTVTLIPLTAGVTFITFVLSQVLPADPATNVAGDYATNAQVEAVRAQLGLDQPIWLQYLGYLGRLVHGDLGTSIFTGRPVAQDIGRYFVATWELATVGMVLALIGGGLLGVLAAVHKDRVLDHAGRVVALVGASTPVFWLGLLLILIFYSILGWFPGSGRYTLGSPLPRPVTQSLLLDSLLQGQWSALWDGLRHIALPAITVGVMGAGVIARVTRASMLDVLKQEYMRAARAKGLSQRRVIYVHGLRNGLLPTVTVAGITYGALLGGAVLTETIFNWPGLGRYAVQAMFRQDYPALMGVVIVMALAYLLVNLLVDVLYMFINPLLKT